MAVQITFNELRKLKSELPEGTMRLIAERLDLNIETVRNYFGGNDIDKGVPAGFHYQQGPDGGIVELDDPTILNMARTILEEQKAQK